MLKALNGMTNLRYQEHGGARLLQTLSWFYQGHISRMANKLSLRFPSRSIQKQEMPFFHLSYDIFICTQRLMYANQVLLYIDFIIS